MDITKHLFGQTKTGEAVFAFELTNRNDMKVTVLTYGAAVQGICFDGTDVVLGYDNMAGYEAQDKFMGAIAGRFANRIGGGTFALNGTTYTLYCNDGENHLHGGKEGFDKKNWTADIEEDAICLRYTSPNGEEGYPGTLCTEVRYMLDDENRLTIDYRAVSDDDTIVNLTNHSYFNLKGHDAGTLEGHQVMIPAAFYTENDSACLPNGVIASVEGTPMDFRAPHEILERIGEDFVQLKNGHGYDHNWIPDGFDGETVRKCAEAYCPETGICMEVYSDQPGMQFYSGNFLGGEVKGKDGAVYGYRSGFCFETQGFPNAAAFGHFPSPVLRQGDMYHRQTIFAFSKK